jgi:hypothetical protein
MNMVAVVKLARKMGPGRTIVTLLPDAGHRHWSSLWSPSQDQIVQEYWAAQDPHAVQDPLSFVS